MRVEHRPQAAEDAALPVDQRAVAVEREGVEVVEADGRHGAVSCQTCPTRRDTWVSVRAAVVRDAVGIGVATGAYALSFGAISTAAGFSIAQTCVLSLAMFTGASQFALVGVVGTGGAGSAGVAATAVLLGTRNALYGVRLAPLLGVSGCAGSGRRTWSSTRAPRWRRPVRTRAPAAWASGRPASPSSCAGTPGRRSAPWAPACSRIRARWASTRQRPPRSSRSSRRGFCTARRRRWPRSPCWRPCVSTPFVAAGVPVLLAALVAVAAGLRPRAGGG